MTMVMYPSRTAASVALLSALFAVVVLLLAAGAVEGANTTVNFNFKGLIPSRCTQRSTACATRSPFKAEQEPSIFASLTADEMLDVEQWLLGQESLGLVPVSEATLSDNYIFYIDALPPVKSEALAYLDDDGARPARYAHAVLYMCRDQAVQELKVGPLPTSEETTATRWDRVTYPGEQDLPFNSRIPDDIEYTAIDEAVLLPFAERLNDIMLESFGATYANCEENCITYSDSAPRSSSSSPNARQTWFFWVYDVDGLWIQAVGLETLVEHNSTDPKDFKLIGFNYMGQNFESVDEFIEAYNSDTINKINVRLDSAWSSFTRQGDVLPGDDIPGPRHINQAGSRFTVNGNTHVEYLGWAFDWSITPLTGVSLWDIRFQGERIVYEMGTQEVYVPYSGRAAAQAQSIYFDTAWGFGASAFPLKAGVDCPAHAEFLNVTQYYLTGEPVVHPNAICVFEQDLAIPVRRHYESLKDDYGGTPSRSLVFRHIVTDYNYDYVLDYVFHSTGTLETKVAASGFLQATFYTEEEAGYGSPRVGPYTSGTFHQHMFCFKVDIDVLGTTNTMRVMSLVPTTYDAPWFDVPQTRPLPVVHTVRNESESTFVPDYNAPTTYMFVNEGMKNSYGVDRAYRFHSTSYVKQLYGDIMGESASWANYHIAVVKRKEEEPTINNVYAQARPYDPSVSGRRSLDKWLSDEDSLEQEDLVAYINVGMNHIPHAEDVPVTVTPTSHVSFVLQPHNYFDRDPASALRDGVVAYANGEGVIEESTQDSLLVDPAQPCVFEVRNVPQIAPHAVEQEE